MKGMRFAVAAVALLWTGSTFATETITYSYDAKGRLTKVVRSGTVNNGVNVAYQHDKADNRQRVVVTGAPQ